ncbi:MAG TPA: hypothetical protein VKN35_04490 [Xanthomonadales bacterium]|nr:hypothetical protein [Xanthomonadales bacterium]
MFIALVFPVLFGVTIPVVLVLPIVVAIIVFGVMAAMIYILNGMPIVAFTTHLHTIGMAPVIAVPYMTLSSGLTGKSQ